MWRRVFLSSCCISVKLDERHCSTATTNSGSDGASENSAGAAGAAGIDQRKLDLALNLSNADFGKIVRATKAAVAREKRWKDAAVWEVLATKEASLVTESAGCGVVASLAVATEKGDNGKDDNTHAAAENHTAYNVVFSEGKTVRYSLMDALRDCFLAGNWTKAMRLFETAVNTSLTMRRDAAPFFSTAPPTTSKVEEKESLEALRVINATTPPGMFFGGKTKHCGILRWNGGHFYMLLKLLLSRHRVAEAERVWDVMKRIGFLEFHMDAFTLNRCIALATSSTSSDIILSLPNASTHAEDRMKLFRKIFLDELEELARKRNLVLNGRNQHVTRRTHFAEGIRSENWENEVRKDVSALNGQGLKVGDFAGLLRRCVSEEETARIIQMMDKLGIHKDNRIYSALIFALRQPQYHLTGDEGAPNEKSTKDEYDAHRKRRLECARKWFFECPEQERTADVYNEILQITRGGKEEDEEFQRLLVEFRGGVSLPLLNSTCSADSCGNFEKDAKSQGGKNKSGKDPLRADVTQQPRWRTCPNGRTYEIMISHCRYLQEWQAMWKLYDEMMEQRVKGTRRLYEMLLEVAARNPPSGRESHAVVMELYEDLKRSGVNVTSIKSTVSVVNAWCATRRRKRW